MTRADASHLADAELREQEREQAAENAARGEPGAGHERGPAAGQGGRPDRGLRPGVARRIFATLRNLWRQLTSMRTALVLLFLLALGSLPGALLPQWSLNASKTAQYMLDHPFLGKWLDRLGFFDVFGSPWYSAIYLLLFVSLIGCVLPRSAEFAKQLRMPPVATPRNLARLPHHESLTVTADPQQAAERIRGGLRGWRTVVRNEPGGVVTVSAEKGYLRELGNLVFHLALLGLLVSVGVGEMVGYAGSILVNAGSGFCSSAPGSYDNFRPGKLVDGTDMPPFCVQVDSFTAAYTPQGEATDFRAQIRYQEGAQAGTDVWQHDLLRVNHPLRIEGQRLYLLGHGYTPKFTVTYPNGDVRDYESTFQPMDSMFTSQGAVKITDPPGYPADQLRKHQLAIVGIFAPTALVNGGIMTSTYPAVEAPGVAVEIYRGDLGMEGGSPQSVFTIDQSQVTKGALVQVARKNLGPGESITLSDGTKITFSGYVDWVSLQTSYDPAQLFALIFAILIVVGLMGSLLIKRRRVWFRLRPVDTRAGGGGTGGPDPGRDQVGSGGEAPGEGPLAVPASAGRTVVDVGGLARSDQAGYGEEFGKLVELARCAGSPETLAGRDGVPQSQAGVHH